MKTITLKKPIQVGEGPEVVELRFREEIVAGDLRGIKVSETMLIDDVLKIAGRLCAQPDTVMNRLSVNAGDMATVLELVSSFMSGGPTTGQKP